MKKTVSRRTRVRLRPRPWAAVWFAVKSSICTLRR